ATEAATLSKLRAVAIPGVKFGLNMAANVIGHGNMRIGPALLQPFAHIKITDFPTVRSDGITQALEEEVRQQGVEEALRLPGRASFGVLGFVPGRIKSD